MVVERVDGSHEPLPAETVLDERTRGLPGENDSSAIANVEPAEHSALGLSDRPGSDFIETPKKGIVHSQAENRIRLDRSVKEYWFEIVNLAGEMTAKLLRLKALELDSATWPHPVRLLRQRFVTNKKAYRSKNVK
jgi:hypothetical protein